MTSAPVRTCAGCGRKAPKAELVRFVAPEGVLIAGQTAPGRGVYTCRRLSCYERALSRRAFARTLRRPVRVESGLERLYTEAGKHG
ncbi:MAG: YlxR family protein [Gaiellaceae bacterium]